MSNLIVWNKKTPDADDPRDGWYSCGNCLELGFDEPWCPKCGEGAKEVIAFIRKELAQVKAECEEQARLNGMGSSREAALMAKLERAEKELEGWKKHAPADIKELREKLWAAEDGRAKAEKERDDFAMKLTKALNEIAALRKERDEAKAIMRDLDMRDDLLASLRSEVAALKNTIEELTNTGESSYMEKLSAAESERDLYKRNWEETEATVEKVESEVAALKAERDGWKQRAEDQGRRNLQLANTAHAELVKAESELSALRKKLEEWKAGAEEEAHEADRLRSVVAALKEREKALTAVKDGAYSERNKLVAAMSKMFPASLERHDGIVWEEDWRWVVFIDLPTGQASWHIHDSEVPQFAHLPRKAGRKWDGHTNDEKYARLAALTPAQAKGEE